MSLFTTDIKQDPISKLNLHFYTELCKHNNSTSRADNYLYPSIFNVSLNLCTSVQKYMYKMYIPLYKQCIIRLFCNVYQCTIISYCNCVPVYDHLFLHLPLCTSVPNNVPVYEMQMCTSVCKVCLCHGIVYKCTQ